MATVHKGSQSENRRAAPGEELGHLLVPARTGSLRQIACWIEGLSGELPVEGIRVCGLRDAVAEACENAIFLDPSGLIDLKALLDEESLVIEVRARTDYARALCEVQGPRRHEGFGFPRMAALVDELTVCRLPPCDTIVRFSLHLAA